MSDSSDQGSLKEKPVPRVLIECATRSLTGSLCLRDASRVKTILLVDGAPVFAESSDPNEGIGRFLVRSGYIDEATAFRALSQGVEKDQYIGDALVEMGVLTPNQLFEAVRRCFGGCILEAFRWDNGEFDWQEGGVDGENRLLLPVDPRNLVLRGVMAHTPIDVVTTDMGPDIEARFVCASGADTGALPKLNGLESRMHRQLRSSVGVVELATSAKVSEEVALRFVYALRLLGALDIAVREAKSVASKSTAPNAERAEALEAKAARATASRPKPEPRAEGGAGPGAAPAVRKHASAATRSVGLSAKEKADLERAYLNAKNHSYFSLLGVPENAKFGELRRALFARCGPVAMLLFGGRPLGEHRAIAEDLFLTIVRAFGTLADPDLRARYLEARDPTQRKARRTEEKRAEPSGGSGPKESGHVARAQGLMAKGRYSAARDLLEVAIGLGESGAEVRGYFGYCVFRSDGEAVKALEHLDEALAIQPAWAEGHFLKGSVLEASSESKLAMQSYARCLRHAPAHTGAREAVERVRSAVIGRS